MVRCSFPAAQENSRGTASRHGRSRATPRPTRTTAACGSARTGSCMLRRGRWPMSLFAQGRALIIGIADYRAARSLPAARRNDAVALQQMLVSPLFVYAAERVESLLEPHATRVPIL